MMFKVYYKVTPSTYLCRDVTMGGMYRVDPYIGSLLSCTEDLTGCLIEISDNTSFRKTFEPKEIKVLSKKK